MTSSSALSSAVSGSTARVVRISGNISCSGMITVGSNKSILGNSGATLTGCGLNVSNASNVIIRNVNFTGWNDDAINVQYSTRVWIDHNSLSNGFDGAIDIKRSSDYITVSWNRIFNHDKSMLLGHSDDNAGEDVGHLRVTYHHNWFDGTNQRHPRVRFGNPVHVYNNYYDAVGSYGVASTEGAGVLVEGNYFENTDDPYHLGEGDSGPGTLVARNNTFVGSGSGQAGGSVASIPYSYSHGPVGQREVHRHGGRWNGSRHRLTRTTTEDPHNVQRVPPSRLPEGGTPRSPAGSRRQRGATGPNSASNRPIRTQARNSDTRTATATTAKSTARERADGARGPDSSIHGSSERGSPVSERGRRDGSSPYGSHMALRQAGDLDGHAEPGARRAVVDALERRDVGVVAAPGDRHVTQPGR